MSQLIEFASNNLILVAAFFVVLTLIIKAELESRIGGVPQLGAVEAVRILNDDNTLVLDVREANEYSGGHIRNAVHIPLTALDKRLNEVEKYKDRPVLVYCRSGSRSYSACKKLKKAGFETLYNLKGGIMAWSSANLPVTSK